MKYVDDAGEGGAASPTLWLMHASIVCKSKAGTGVATRGDVDGGSGGGALNGISDVDVGEGGGGVALSHRRGGGGSKSLCGIVIGGFGSGSLPIGGSRVGIEGIIAIDFSGLSFALILSPS